MAREKAIVFPLSNATEAVFSRRGLMLVRGSQAWWLSASELRKLRATLDEQEKEEE